MVDLPETQITQPAIAPVFDAVGVCGAGAMGRGIAQMCLLAGSRVSLYDTQAPALVSAMSAISAGIRKWVEKGKLTASQADTLRGRLTPATALDELASCNLVVEAIVEDLAAKRALLHQLESVVSSDCVLASNTSSLSIAALAAQCRAPARVAGWHFFNPVPLMRLVEVIAGPHTSPIATAQLNTYTQQFGHVPVIAKDSPGFIVNHAGRGFGTEALAIVKEGATDFATIDRIMRGAGFRLGPFELMDLTALDVSHPVMESVYRQFYEEPRFRPSPITAQRLAAGLVGKKAGQGFYDYRADAAQPQPPAVPNATLRPIWMSAESRARAPWLVERLHASGGLLDDEAQPSAYAAVLLTPLGLDCTTAALRAGVEPTRSVAVDTIMPVANGQPLTLMSNPATQSEVAESVHASLAQAGYQVERIKDSAGFVAQRIIAMIAAIASEIAQQRIATPKDIDTAVTLGLSYPKGPLAWGDAIGAETLRIVLMNLFDITKDPRYRPSLWLTRRAQLGLSLLTED
jgi:3-hydroxybutyryl-CoA dehydrogenase